MGWTHPKGITGTFSGSLKQCFCSYSTEEHEILEGNASIIIPDHHVAAKAIVIWGQKIEISNKYLIVDGDRIDLPDASHLNNGKDLDTGEDLVKVPADLPLRFFTPPFSAAIEKKDDIKFDLNACKEQLKEEIKRKHFSPGRVMALGETWKVIEKGGILTLSYEARMMTGSDESGKRKNVHNVSETRTISLAPAAACSSNFGAC